MKTQVSALIDCETLKKWQSSQQVVVLFTQMINPVNPTETKQYNGYIPGSLLFDFEGQFCDKTSNLPHTIPQPNEFSKELGKLGVTNDSIVVIYDAQAMFCAPRVWWMFKVMGHQKVFVLNGGLSNWIESGFEIQNILDEPKTAGEYKATFQSDLLVSKQQVLAQINQQDSTVLDARSLPRFFGEAPEPRAGVRSGHVPNSKCLSYSSLIEDNKIMSPAQLQTQFNKVDFQPATKLIFSCGSGVTACILALAAHEIGIKNWAVYDGSWTEWGSDLNLPVSLSD